MKPDTGLTNEFVYARRNGGPRKAKIDAVVIHHMAGIMTARSCAYWWNDAPYLVNSTYTIGKDGDICQCIPESYRPWTTSGIIDERCVTIEVSNNGGAPDWPVSDASLQSCIKLIADIFKRNGIKECIYTGNPYKDNILRHKDFAQTDCPGKYLSSKFMYIKNEVNKLLKDPTIKPPNDEVIYRVQVGAFKTRQNAVRLRDELKKKGYEAFVTGDTK